MRAICYSWGVVAVAMLVVTEAFVRAADPADDLPALPNARIEIVIRSPNAAHGVVHVLNVHYVGSRVPRRLDD